MKKFLLPLIITGTCLSLSGVDLLKNRNWELVRTWNAAGTLSFNKENLPVVENTAGKGGFVTFNCSEDEYIITPEKNYTVRCEFENSSPAIRNSLFVALPGARRIRKPDLRTPWATGNSVEISFRAGKDERRLAIYLSLAGSGKTTIKKISIEENTPPADLLARELPWRKAGGDAGRGEFTKENGTLTVAANASDGYMLVLNAIPVDIAPGKKITLTAIYQKVLPGTAGHFLFNTGQRRPWPSVALEGEECGKNYSVSHSFTAAENENHLTVYFSVNKTGKISVKNIFLKEE